MLLTGKNHFIIRSNDLFEVRTYSRAVDFSRGEFIILLQDDDLPPENGAWIKEAIKLFEQQPKLAILGGHWGGELQVSKSDPAQVETHHIQHDVRKIDSTGRPFDFVEFVNRAPMFYRRSALNALGGIDQAFAPFQGDDMDICLKAWLNGYHVGLYHAAFIRDVGVGGMRLFNSNTFVAQSNRSFKIIEDRYGESIIAGHFSNLVKKARQDAGI